MPSCPKDPCVAILSYIYIYIFIYLFIFYFLFIYFYVYIPQAILAPRACCWHCCEEIVDSAEKSASANQGTDSPSTSILPPPSPFSSRIPMPRVYDAAEGVYYVYGVACSPACAKAYIIEHTSFDRAQHLNTLAHMLRDLYGIEGHVVETPPRPALARFGGSFDPRRATAAFECRVVEPPFVSYCMLVEERGGERVDRGGKEGSGREGSGREGSGKEGSGKEGSGKEGSGREGNGKERSGREGNREEIMEMNLSFNTNRSIEMNSLPSSDTNLSSSSLPNGSVEEADTLDEPPPPALYDSFLAKVATEKAKKGGGESGRGSRKDGGRGAEDDDDETDSGRRAHRSATKRRRVSPTRSQKQVGAGKREERSDGGEGERNEGKGGEEEMEKREEREKVGELVGEEEKERGTRREKEGNELSRMSKITDSTVPKSGGGHKGKGASTKGKKSAPPTTRAGPLAMFIE